MVAPTSRYNYSVLYRSKKGDFWGTRPPLVLRPHPTDQFHRVTDGDSKRIDLIAWQYYRDVSLWWVIAEVNGIGNPLELQPGTVLRIPSYDRIQMRVVR
jgi:nucleoid-associated protein YgaU